MKPTKALSANRMRVPILLPTGRDAALVAHILNQREIDVVTCTSLRELLVQLGDECGPFIVADEALSRQSVDRLVKTLRRQPDWSNLPGIILKSPYTEKKFLSSLSGMGNLSLIQRPVGMTVFKNLIKTAIEARRRQFQVRDLLEEMVEANQKLRSRTDLLQKLSLELTRAENQERRRIAQILHDDLQPLLASGKLYSELLFDDIDSQLTDKIRKLHDIFSEAMQSSRSLSHELNPAFIISGNLETALRKLMKKISADYKLDTKVTGHLDNGRIAEEIQLFVYRSVQEMLFNCFKHAEATQASLELKHQGNNLKVAVSDDGKGMEPDTLKVLYANEVGFGLFSIHERVTALGGSLEIQSDLDKGCRIILDVPGDPNSVYDNAATPADDRSPLQGVDRHGHPAEITKSKPISVMIADDHAVVRQGLARLLKSRPDFEVVAEAADGEQAVVLALQFRPDAVLMDISMPLLNGIEATRSIKEEAPDIVIFGLSAIPDQTARRHMLDAGARECLSKDIRAEVLFEKIRKALL